MRPGKITLENIKAVFKAKQRQLSGILLPEHIYEQVIWRRFQVEKTSPECLSTNACKVCGCDILGKTLEDRACSASEHPDLNLPTCYPEMKNKEDWEKFKKENNIKYFL